MIITHSEDMIQNPKHSHDLSRQSLTSLEVLIKLSLRKVKAISREGSSKSSGILDPGLDRLLLSKLLPIPLCLQLLFSLNASSILSTSLVLSLKPSIGKDLIERAVIEDGRSGNGGRGRSRNNRGLLLSRLAQAKEGMETNTHRRIDLSIRSGGLELITI